jgi:hypothetical protein
MWEYPNLENDVTVNLWEKVAVIQCEDKDISSEFQEWLYEQWNYKSVKRVNRFLLFHPCTVYTIHGLLVKKNS